MKLYDMGLVLFLVVLTAAVGTGIVVAKKNKPDSYAEELCEEVVEQAMRGPSGSGERLSPA